MRKLRVVSAELEVADLELKPGEYRVGRVEDNDWIIPHPSVSSHHCLLKAANDTLSVTDLGSTNGTYLNDQQIEETAVAPGQELRLGDVRLNYEVEPAAPALTVGGLSICHQPKEASPEAAQEPSRLEQRFTPSISSVSAPGLDLPPTFFQSLPGAFSYPVKGDAWLLLVLGTLFFGAIDLAGMFMGFLGMGILGVFGTGYFFSYVQGIIATTGMGDNRGPEWPEFSDWWEDIVIPAIQFTVTNVVVFVPAVLWLMFAPENLKLAAIPLALLGVIYLPMGFLAVAMLDTVFALNPMLIVPSILKVPLAYLTACATLGLILGVQYGTELLAEVVIPIPIVPALIGGSISFYFISVMARILGLLYYYNREELDWT